MSIQRLAGFTRFAIISVSIFAAVNFMGLTGCKSDSNYFSANNASIGGADGSTADATAGFRVRIKTKTGVDAFLHKFGNVSTACEVPLTSITTPTSIQCMLNMMEYDLWFYGFETELSVPASICKYVTDSPMRYYTALPGIGIRSATISTTNGLITACSIDGQAGVISGGSCSGPEGTVSAGGGVSCAYDYTSSKGPNCCQGTAIVGLTATVNTVAPPTTTVSNVTTQFTGSLLNCLYSAHDYVEKWPLVAPENKASNVIYPVGAGSLVVSTKLQGAQGLFMANKRTFSAGNFLNAGFHDWAAYVANPATWITTHSLPISIRPIADLGPLGNSAGDALPSAGDGSETFNCINEAGEVKHQIKMFVNEWNTIEDYMSFKAGASPTAVTPIRTGTAGIDCSALNDGSTCDSLWGFDDLRGVFGAAAFPLEWLRGKPN